MNAPISTCSPASDNDSRVEKLLRARKVLFVGAHPDDIEFYSAGLVHLLRGRGANVTFLIGTRGGKGRSGAAKARLEGLRSSHQADSAEILGGAKVVLLDYPDKDLAKHIPEFAEEINRLVSDLAPDVLFSWDPEHIKNPHPDHQAAADAVKLASPRVPICFYGTLQPNLWVGFGEEVFQIKIKSLRAHRTETPWYYFILLKRHIIKNLTGEGRKIGSPYAETLRESTTEN